MTVSTTHAVKQYNGGGAGVVNFAVDFVFFLETDLIVTLISSLGAETVQTIQTNYTVTGGQDDNGQPNLGTVIMVIGPAVGEKLRIERNTPVLQQVDFNLGANFNPETVEAMGDRDRCIDQEILLRGGLRDVKLNITDYLAGFSPILPVASANKFLRINSGNSGFALTSGLTWRGLWMLGTPYVADELVEDGGSSWICKQAHTASADKEPGVGGSYAAYWDLAAQKGATGATGATGNNGTDGTNGIDAGVLWLFDSSTSMADPGTGNFRLNNATLSSVTQIAVNYLSSYSGNPSVAAWVQSWDDSTNTANRGVLIFRDQSSPQNFAIYTINAALTDNGTWAQVPVTHVSSNGSLTGTISVQFYRTGDTATATLSDNSVTFAKMQDINTDRLIGRDTAGVGDPEEIALDTTLEFTGSQSIRRAALTGDVTASAGSNSTTIANNAVTDVKLRDSAAVSVIGRSANSSGDPADIAAASDGQVLRRASSAVGFGALDLASANSLTGDLPFANLTQGSARSVLGVTGNATADFASIQGTTDQVLRVDSAGTGLSFGTVATAGIANDAVTYAKIQNVTSARLLGRATAGSGDTEEITLGTNLSYTGTTLNAAGGSTIAPQVEVRTGSATVTIPTGATKLFFILVGGSGGGGGGVGTGGCTPANGTGGGGGGGGALMKYLSGLTPGNTLSLTIGAAGTAGAATPTAGGAGGNSSLASGTQTITTLTASGGGGGGAGNNAQGTNGAGGTGTNGDSNHTGEAGTNNNGPTLSHGGGPGIGFGQGHHNLQGNAAGAAGVGWGGGGSGGNASGSGTTRAGGAGTAGGAIFFWFP